MAKITTCNDKHHGACDDVPENYDELADHTECGIDSDYDSDREVRENEKFESGLDPNDGATKAIRQAMKAGRYCRKCAKAFDTVAGYRTHLKATKNHYLCRYCKSFKDYGSLKDLRNHYQKRHEGFYCQYCRLEFKSPKEKEKHSESEHCVCDRFVIINVASGSHPAIEGQTPQKAESEIHGAIHDDTPNERSHAAVERYD
ncbi:hypothetical protein MMC07_003888 [Pseudocyphellaria aurata]|nr:hypothetical protein [Pseudocyphellaria aurata]